MKDPIEEAIKALDINHATPNYENLTGGKEQKILVCPHCKFTQYKIVKTEKDRSAFECLRCGEISHKWVLRKSVGVAVSETRSRKIRSLVDSDLPDVRKIKTLSRQAVEWVTYAHTSIYRGSHEKEKKAILNLKWYIFCEIVNQINTKKAQNPVFVARLMVLIGEVVENYRKRGDGKLNNADLALAIRVNRSQFNAGRFWGITLCLVTECIAKWEDEALKAFEG
jgi:hypothetical protein